MKKVTLIALLSLLCLLFIVPNAFAFDNQTVNATDGGDVLSGEYYFDISIENDTGDGSRYNPYKEFTPERIEDNSVFYLADGEYTLTRNVKVNNVTIIGQNPQKTVITYASTHNGLESKNSLTLKNLTLVNLPIMSKGDLTATNVLFCNAHADKGGAICADNNDETCITLNNCTFYNNNAQYGGAIYLSSGALIIEGSSFISNYATFYGGAITTESSNVTVRKSKFINDYTLKGDGGAMVIYNSDNFTGHDLEFTRCYATFGGALSILHSFSDLKNIVAKSNRAKYDGGAIYSMYLTLSMTDCTFDNNSASNGGAVYADMEEILYISNNHFVNNMAAKNGGAVYSILSDTYDLSILTEMNNTFHNNNASLNNDVFQSDVVDLAIGSRNYSLIRFIPSYNGTLPESYDLRQLGWVTPVKNQGSNGNCWAFAALASLESCLLKVLNVSYDLSEANMKNLMGLFSDYGWAMATNTGGYDKMAIGYLTSWMGPVNESDDEYYIGNLLSPILNSMFHIQNVKYLTRTDYNDNDAIKRAIIDYGAVSTSIYWSSSYLRGKNYYNNGANAANHAVTIVGWDDDYSKSNFRTAPPGDGAWIIKNSWGTGSGEKGFVYVSYYDAKLAPLNKPEATFTFILNDTIKFDKNYQYDIPGKTDYLLNFTDTVWYKNKFIATDDEYLAAVSTFFEKETSWELSVYVNDVLKAFKSGKSLPSYSTINLDEFIPLKSGDSFEIMFKITVDGDAGVPISEEISLNNILYTENISYISYDGKHWKDLFNLSGEYPNHNYYSQVACIKAFTFLNPINSSVILEICNVRSNLLDIIANVVDEYGNPIRSGKVTFDVANTKKTVDVVNGIARMENVEIKPGINRYEAQFSANAYVPSIDSVLFSSPLINTVLSLGFSSLDVNPIEITASVVDEYGNAVLCGHVTFNVEGINYTVDVEDGVAKLVRTFDFGVKNVSAVYGDAYCYNASYDEKTIVIYGLDTFVSISVDSKYNPVPIRVGVIDENGEKVNQGYVRFTLDNQNYIVNVTDGRAGIEHVFKRLQGSKRVTATYFDDSYKYHSSENFTYIDVELKSSNMELNVESGNYTNPVELVATITDGDNNTIDEGIVRFNIDGVWFDVNVVNGTAALDGVFTDVGLNNVTVSYDGLYYYKPSQIDVCLNISKIPVNLSFGVEKSSDNIKFIFTASEPIDEYLVSYINEIYHLIKFTNGTAVYDLDFYPGRYVIDASLSGYIYESDSVHEEINISEIATSVICEDFAGYVSKDNRYSVCLKDEYGTLISNASVSLTVNGKSYKSITNGSGVAVFKFDLGVGKYGATVEYGGNYKYSKSSAGSTVIIKSTIEMDSNSKFTYNFNYVATLLDSDGNPLKNREVSFGIDEKIYSVFTDSQGVLSYNLKLNPGSYKISILNIESSESKYQTIKVTKRIDSNKDVTMYYAAGKSYSVRVYDDHGNVLKNAKVTFKVNGKTYYRYSNANGYASLKISLNPKTYTITAEYKGYKVSNKIVVKSTLVLSSKTVKRSKTFKYTVKLLNSNGKILKNKKVTVKFRGKTYVAKTNAKGIANYKIKALSKTGKFALTAIYGSLKVSKTITVKK